MALPIDFISRTRGLLGADYPAFEAALQGDSPVSIRLNRSKTTIRPDGEPVPWAESGFYLSQRLSFTFDPLFHAGVYYVQEASSMFLEQAIRTWVDKPVRCLDLCAAPGGKSTHLLGLLPENSLLVSNEVIRSRSYILSENITKWGAPNVIVTHNDPEEIGQMTHFFDVILTDVPCSGEGMFRKDADSTGEWSVANVELCASRQRRIIRDIWNALAPGGILIYSTCTYNTEENEENVHYMVRELGAQPLEIPHSLAWNITGPLKYTYPVSRFLPHKTKGEGFFLAVLRKPDGVCEVSHIRQKGKKDKAKAFPAQVSQEIRQWILSPEEMLFKNENMRLAGIPAVFADAYAYLSQRLRIIHAGITLGEIKGKDVIPSQSVVQSALLNPKAFVRHEVSWEEAIRFLRKEAMLLPDSLPKGYVVLTYQHYPLGVVKHLGNRANNLYPPEWRIRSGYQPDQIRMLL